MKIILRFKKVILQQKLFISMSLELTIMSLLDWCFTKWATEAVENYSISSVIYSHEIYHIPTNYDFNTLYRLDNAYYFEKIPNYNQIKLEHKNNPISSRSCRFWPLDLDWY